MREDAAGSCTVGRAKAAEWKGIMEWAGMRSRLGHDQASRLSVASEFVHHVDVSSPNHRHPCSNFN